MDSRRKKKPAGNPTKLELFNETAQNEGMPIRMYNGLGRVKLSGPNLFSKMQTIAIGSSKNKMVKQSTYERYTEEKVQHWLERKQIHKILGYYQAKSTTSVKI